MGGKLNGDFGDTGHLARVERCTAQGLYVHLGKRRVYRVFAADYHRARPSKAELDAILRLEQERTISQDWVVQYQGRWLQIERESRYAPAGGKVTVSEGPDGRLAITYRGRAVRWQEIPRPAPRSLVAPTRKAPAVEVRKSGQPAASNHPWKKWRPSWLQPKAARSRARGAL